MWVGLTACTHKNTAGHITKSTLFSYYYVYILLVPLGVLTTLRTIKEFKVINTTYSIKVKDIANYCLVSHHSVILPQECLLNGFCLTTAIFTLQP